MPFTPQQSFMIGPYTSGSAAMTNLEVDGSGNYSPPNVRWKKYSKQVQLGDATVRGAGWTECEWTWEVMTRTQRDWLRAFCTGQSSEVWIKTIQFDNTDAYQVYHAVMVWPIESEERDAHRRMKFTLKFQALQTT
jgi:hypothetical protein